MDALTLSRTLAEAKRYLAVADDPRNSSSALIALKLLVAYIESQSKPE